jgi:acetylornithine/N-succinyldiaminopimelate aminotransferase
MKLFDVYPLMNIDPVKAKGSKLWDTNGNEYLDLYGGHAVISIGHGHPYYVAKLTSQLNKIGFYSNSVINHLSGYTSYNLFLCNSGAEANENALKLASFHNKRKKVIAFDKSFHGRTSLAVAATDDPSIQAGVNKDHEIIFLPLNNEEAFLNAMNEEVCAVILEGIQGVGGIRIPNDTFMQLLRKKCSETGALLILDEIQSGYGRSGKFFAHQYSEIAPDIVTVAKGMGNGFPIGAVLISPEIKSTHGMLGTTFGGNHLACAAAIAVLDIIKSEDLIRNAAIVGKRWKEELQKINTVKEVRGLGLMLGIEFDFPIGGLRSALATDHRMLVGTSSNKNMLRLLPALTIGETETNLFTNALQQVLTKQLQQTA